jgi:dihydrofolate reductase
MGRIVISENVTLDGVVEDPTGEEGFSLGGWFTRIGENDREAWAEVVLHEALGAEGFLLGRRSYEYLAERWPTRTGALADRLNSMPKYVVSSTLEDPGWSNSTVLEGDTIDAVSRLRHQVDGEVVVAASFGLVPMLMEHDLVDELRLTIYPFVLGAGRRLFGEVTDMKAMRLAESRTLGDGLAFLTYRTVRDA